MLQNQTEMRNVDRKRVFFRKAQKYFTSTNTVAVPVTSEGQPQTKRHQSTQVHFCNFIRAVSSTVMKVAFPNCYINHSLQYEYVLTLLICILVHIVVL